MLGDFFCCWLIGCFSPAEKALDELGLLSSHLAIAALWVSFIKLSVLLFRFALC